MCYRRLMKSYLVLSKEREYLFCTYFCQTMKIPFKAIAALIILSLIGVFAYQAYWLTGLYTSMKKDMDNCLIETLQVSDYNEMMERCDSVKRSNETINGYIESSINLDSSALITKVIETEPFKQQKRFGLEINEPVSTTIDKNGTLELLTKYFQRGIHSQLDLFTEINQPFYKDTCHARNHLPASPHRNSEFTSRQHGRTRTQLTSKIQAGQRSSELLLQL
jgi:hypothetical protein